MNWPSLVWSGLSLAYAGLGTRCMNHPPAYCCMHDFALTRACEITRTAAAAAWALTTLCSVMHCNLQTSLGRDGVWKTKTLPLPPPIKHLSTLPAPFSSCSLHSPALLSLPLLSLTLCGHSCLCFHTASSLLQSNLCYKHLEQGQNMAAYVNQAAALFIGLFCSTCV